MGPRWARRPEEGSPQESAGVPANTRERARKKANSELLTFVYWWSRGGSNPRPQALYRQFYILSPVFLSFRLDHARRTGWILPSRLGFDICPSDPDRRDFM